MLSSASFLRGSKGGDEGKVLGRGRVKALPYLTSQPSLSALPFPLDPKRGHSPVCYRHIRQAPSRRHFDHCWGHVPREKGKEGYSSSMGLKGSCQAIASASLAYSPWAFKGCTCWPLLLKVCIGCLWRR